MASFELPKGAPPPWLIPFCASCGEGVERFTLHPITADGILDVEAQCHGQTQGIRLTTTDLLKRSVSGEPVVVFRGVLRTLVDAVVAGHART